MGESLEIVRVDPPAAVAGGEVVVECHNFERRRIRSGKVFFKDKRAWLVGASPRRLLALVPDFEEGGEVESSSKTARACAAPRRASSPAGSWPKTCTSSPTRPLTRGRLGRRHALRLARPAGSRLALPHRPRRRTPRPPRRDHEPHRDSLRRARADVRLQPARRDGLPRGGRPRGDAVRERPRRGDGAGLRPPGYLYVGDRQGKIFRVNGAGEGEEWARSEPSVSAYHMAFGPDAALYLTGPTVSSYDTVTRIDEHGRRSTFFRGLGRPQGLAFDRDGTLYVAASYRGRRGVVAIDRGDREARLVVAGMNVVGLAFNSAGDMLVATNEAVYSLPLGIRGTLV